MCSFRFPTVILINKEENCDPASVIKTVIKNEVKEDMKNKKEDGFLNFRSILLITERMKVKNEKKPKTKPEGVTVGLYIVSLLLLIIMFHF